MANGVAANKVADFLGQIFGVVSGALEGLRHEDDLEAGVALQVFGIFDMAEKNQIAQTVYFSIGTKHVDGFLDVAGGEGSSGIRQHFLEHRSHVSKVANVLGI